MSHLVRHMSHLFQLGETCVSPFSIPGSNTEVFKCLQHIAPSSSAYESSKIQLLESLGVFEVTKAGNQFCCSSLDCLNCIVLCTIVKK